MKLIKNRKIQFILLFWIVAFILLLILPEPEAKTSKPISTHEVFIKVPSPCHVVEEIRNDKIILRKATKQCVQMLSRTKVTLNASIKTVKIFVGKKLWQEQSIQGINLNDVHNLLQNSEYIQKTNKKPFMKSPEMKKIAKNLNHFVRSEDYQKKLTEESNRIKKEVFNLPTEDLKQGDPDKPGPQKTLASTERIYLFVSSSIPLQTLRTYAANLEQFGDPNISMVMRGFIDGMKKAGPTLEFISNIMVLNPGCRLKEEKCAARPLNMYIDPLLYKKYDIKRVPALVYVPAYQNQDPDSSEGLGEAPLHYILYGDASLRYLIEELYRHTKKPSLQKLTQVFTNNRGKPWMKIK